MCDLYQFNGLILLTYNKVNLKLPFFLDVEYVLEILIGAPQKFEKDDVLQSPSDILGSQKISSVCRERKVNSINFPVLGALAAFE